MVGVAEEAGEAGAGVEAREATPVDRPLTADQRGRLQVTDQRVVLDPRHGLILRPDTHAGVLVPEPDHRRLALVAKDADGRRGERESSPCRGRHPEPARREHAQEMAVREHDCVAIEGPQLGDHAIRSARDVRCRFTPRAPVAPQVPARLLDVDLRDRQALEAPVVPLDQVLASLRIGAQPGEATGLDRAAEGTGQDAARTAASPAAFPPAQPAGDLRP